MAGYPDWTTRDSPPYGAERSQPQHMQQQQSAASWLLPDYAGNPPTARPVPPPQMTRYAPPSYEGYTPGGFFNPAPATTRGIIQQNVSFDTSAKDPESVKARIFVGSLNTAQTPVTREDIIEMSCAYGRLRGVTFFKKQGYAFVQFESEEIAEKACRGLNGMRFKGCHLDVHGVEAPSRQPFDGRPEKSAGDAQYEDISYDTSSRDPVQLRARVFVGSIAREAVSRADIIEAFLPYGKITAATLFKGYAFVQFESPVDAVAACESVNGTMIRSNKVDVHLAMEGPSRKRPAEEESPVSKPASAWNGLLLKRVVEITPAKSGCELICKQCRFMTDDVTKFIQHREGGGCERAGKTGEPPCLACNSCDAVLPNAWRMLFHMVDDVHHRMKLMNVEMREEVITRTRETEVAKRREWIESVLRWKKEEEKKDEVMEEGEEEEEEDKREVTGVTCVTIVCWQCNLVTDDWGEYRGHEKRGECYKRRDELEPSCLVCAMCQQSFTSAWKALFHLVDFHRMNVFTAKYGKADIKKAAESLAKEKSAVDRRMKTWIDNQKAAN